MKKFSVIGSGDAFASGGKLNTSFMLTDENGITLIDCGATTFARLKQLHIDLASIKTIFITHFHGDHYGALPFLILSYTIEMKRVDPLNIIGPKGIEEKLRNLQDALYPDTSHLIDKLQINFMEYDHQWQSVEKYQFKGLPVIHAPGSNPHGIKIKWRNKSMAYSGDTEWSNSLIELANNTDLFIIECNNYEKESPGHLAYRTILFKSELIKTKTLYLTHMGNDVLAQKNLKFEMLEDGMEMPLW